MLDRRTRAELAQLGDMDAVLLTSAERMELDLIRVRQAGVTLADVVLGTADLRPATGRRAEAIRRRARVRQRLRLPARSCLARRHHEACRCGDAVIDARSDQDLDRLEADGHARKAVRDMAKQHHVRRPVFAKPKSEPDPPPLEAGTAAKDAEELRHAKGNADAVEPATNRERTASEGVWLASETESDVIADWLTGRTRARRWFDSDRNFPEF